MFKVGLNYRFRVALRRRLRRVLLIGDPLGECDPCKPSFEWKEPWAPQGSFLNSGTVAEASKIVKPAASKHATILILDRV